MPPCRMWSTGASPSRTRRRPALRSPIRRAAPRWRTGSGNPGRCRPGRRAEPCGWTLASAPAPHPTRSPMGWTTLDPALSSPRVRIDGSGLNVSRPSPAVGRVSAFGAAGRQQGRAYFEITNDEDAVARDRMAVGLAPASAPKTAFTDGGAWAERRRNPEFRRYSLRSPGARRLWDHGRRRSGRGHGDRRHHAGAGSRPRRQDGPATRSQGHAECPRRGGPVRDPERQISRRSAGDAARTATSRSSATAASSRTRGNSPGSTLAPARSTRRRARPPTR